MTLPIVERLYNHAASHQWFLDALAEHYNRMAERAGSDPLSERARQSDLAPVMREAADTIEELINALRNLREVAGAHIQSCPAFEQTDALLAKIGGAS